MGSLGLASGDLEIDVEFVGQGAMQVPTLRSTVAVYALRNKEWEGTTAPIFLAACSGSLGANRRLPAAEGVTEMLRGDGHRGLALAKQ